MPAPRICLNMIVKNEAHVINGLLEQVRPLIHSWVIVDTGSTDGTQQLIRDFFAQAGLPGELHERPWRDFGHNRSEALTLARGRGDYIWVIDADDRVHGTPDFRNLSHDSYEVKYGPELLYWRRQLFRDGLAWKYVGVLHEYSDCDGPYTTGRLQGDYCIECRHLGDRSRDPNKYRKDAEVLQRALAEDPTSTRNQFYLAQSWFSAGEWARALPEYERRVHMTGWSEEVFYSLYRIALCHQRLGREAEFMRGCLIAHERFPQRAEPLHALAKHCMEHSLHRSGYAFANMGLAVPKPKDGLFVEQDVWDWRLLDIKAVCGFYIGFKGEAAQLNERLLKLAPSEQHARIQQNLAWCTPKV